MRFITISREEWNALFAGKTLTLFRVPFDRVDEYKPGDKLFVHALYQQETATVTIKRVVAFDEGNGFRLDVCDLRRFPYRAYGG